MTDDEFQAYLANRHSQMVQFYDERAGQNKLGYRVLSVYVILISLGLAATLPFVPQDCALLRWLFSILLASIAGASGLLAHFQFHENWLRYRSTWDALQREPHLRTARVGDYAAAPDRNSLFVQRVEALVSAEGAEWLRKSKQSVATPATPPTTLPPTGNQ